MGFKSWDWTLHVICFVAKVLLAAQLHFNIQMSGVCGALLKNKACTFFFPLGERRFSALVSILTTQTLHHCVRSFSGASTHIIRVALIKHQYTLAHWIKQCMCAARRGWKIILARGRASCFSMVESSPDATATIERRNATFTQPENKTTAFHSFAKVSNPPPWSFSRPLAR
jgi:hypothetical protein